MCHFSYNVLGISDNIDELGTPKWEHVLCLLLSWIVVFLCLIKGIKSSGKVRYPTDCFVKAFGPGSILHSRSYDCVPNMHK